MRDRILALALSLLMGSGLSPDAVAAELSPSSDWMLDYADDSCALRRMFGDEKEQVYLELRRFGPNSSFQATVASSRMHAVNPPLIRYRFGEEGTWREAGAANALTLANDFRGVVFRPSLIHLPEYEKIKDSLEAEAHLRTLDIPAIEKEFAANTNSLSIRGAFRPELTLILGRLSEPIAALQKCTDELVTHWGIDVEAHKGLTRPALPINLRQIPRMMPYPPEMIRQSMPGLVNIRLSIDETGRITACHIQMPLSDPEFGESSCADIQHALEFEPALDKDGKPIASYWVTTIHFQMR
jgi:hypothetical protein